MLHIWYNIQCIVTLYLFVSLIEQPSQELISENWKNFLCTKDLGLVLWLRAGHKGYIFSYFTLKVEY